MPNSFHRVNQSLRLDKGLLSGLTLTIALALLTAWVIWAFKASIVRYEVSDSARLEVMGAPYVIQSDMTGKLLSSGLFLGRKVQAGDILVDLDSRDEQLNLSLERTHRAALEPQLAALHAQIEQEGLGKGDEQKVLTFATGNAEAQYRQAEAQASLAAEEAARANRLRAEGLISEAEARRANADAESKRDAAQSSKASALRVQPESQVRDRDRAVRVNQILVDVAKLRAEAATSSANIQRLEYELEKRHIRAPVSGTLTECATLRPGAHVSEGQQIGTIVPSSAVQVVAEFTPSAALGKIRPGQNATVKLQGFPWAQFGTLPARVSRVAGDIRDGNVRVELAVTAPAHSRLPLKHGLPGSVEIEVERVTPALLLLRSAGQTVGAR
jgi:membrane fusion protein (multidrug efflux system)